MPLPTTAIPQPSPRPARPRALPALLACALLWASPARPGTPVVVTDIPAVHALVAQVMAGVGTPQLLLGPGANAHDAQMRPAQAAALAGAGLVIWSGPDMTPGLPQALEAADKAGASLALMAVPGTRLRAVSGRAHEGYGLATGHDPHAWLDPGNAQLWLGTIAGRLAALDPAHAAAYAANARAAQAALAADAAAIRAELAPYDGAQIMVLHDAYGYFTDSFGLRPALPLMAADGAPPGAAGLVALRRQAAAATCIFPEAGHGTALIATVAEGQLLRIGAALDPEGIGIPPGPQAHRTILRRLSAALAACLRGG